MKRALLPLLLVSAFSAAAFAEEADPAARTEKRGWLSRVLHPFGSEPATEYKDARLQGLVLSVKVAPQPVKLSEVRQMDVIIRLTNTAKNPITLEFNDTQRFEIYLRNGEEKVLTTYSENHAFTQETARIMINPGEHIQYDETIATRELTPNRVFIADVFFPQYPDLHVRQKFMTAP